MTNLRDQPLPATWTVREARQAYLDENGFTVAAYDAPRTEGAFLGIRFTVPNTPRHRWAIMRHDLHHIATGYGTDLRGEGEISAWELRAGVGPLGLYVGSIVLIGTLMGLLLAPLRTSRAWRAGARRRSLFHAGGDDADLDALLDMRVGELRKRLGIADTGLRCGRRGLYSLAPR